MNHHSTICLALLYSIWMFNRILASTNRFIRSMYICTRLFRNVLISRKNIRFDCILKSRIEFGVCMFWIVIRACVSILISILRQFITSIIECWSVLIEMHWVLITAYWQRFRWFISTRCISCFNNIHNNITGTHGKLHNAGHYLDNCLASISVVSCLLLLLQLLLCGYMIIIIAFYFAITVIFIVIFIVIIIVVVVYAAVVVVVLVRGRHHHYRYQ